MVHKTYKGLIETLDSHEVFVYGKNTESRHGAGAALVARNKFGAKYGSSKEGLEGQSYGIITKDLTKEIHPSISKDFIIEQIKTLYSFATLNPSLEFYIAYSSDGKNLNGYSNKEMAEMFAQSPLPLNIVFEEGFYEMIIHKMKLKGFFNV